MPIELEQALRDPASSFAGPEDVVAHPDLSQEQKIEILRLWEYDATEAAVATEEGMPGGNNGLLQRILTALAALGERMPFHHGRHRIGRAGDVDQHRRDRAAEHAAGIDAEHEHDRGVLTQTGAQPDQQ